MSDEPVIRRAETPADYRACQEAQRLAWGITEDGYLVPVATLVGAQNHGGLVLGAFLPDGRAVALSFAFLGRIEGRSCLYSQLTGVIPEYQGRGLGLDLKLAQRMHAQKEGIGLLAWSFDPMQAGNANFNLGKLGATAGRFVADMYGPRTDALNAGIPTDRLIAEWSTQGNFEPGPADGRLPDVPRRIKVSRDSDGRLHPGGLEPTTAPCLLIEIPEDIGRLRRDDPGLASEWQLAVRDALTRGFADSYRAIGFGRLDEGGLRRNFYVLARPETARTGRVPGSHDIGED
jgi:predicted GNAT superfamily acetyltransferase